LVAMLAATLAITGMSQSLRNMSATSMDYANNPMVTLLLRTLPTGSPALRTATAHTTRMTRVRTTIPRMITPIWLPHQAIPTVTTPVIPMIPLTQRTLLLTLTLRRTLATRTAMVLPMVRSTSLLMDTALLMVVRSTSLLMVVRSTSLLTDTVPSLPMDMVLVTRAQIL